MDYKKKLKYLLDELGKKHLDFYFVKSKEEVDELYKKALEKFKIEDDYDFHYVSNYLIKQIIGGYDEHTGVFMLGNKLPVILRMFDDKLYIIKSSKELEDFRFKEITAINGVSISKILLELDAVICYDKKEWFRAKVEMALSSSSSIKALPSINPSDNIVFSVGEESINMTEAFNHFDKSTVSKEKNMSYYLDDDVIVINYRQCFEEEEGQMQRLVLEVSELAASHNISKYIVDLRGNVGGNSNIIKPLIKFLDGNDIITLTDYKVFSSGLWACNDLRNIGSTFIGEDIGATYNRFGNIKYFEMDSFRVNYSYKYFYYDDKKGEICSLNEDTFEDFKADERNARHFEKYPFEIEHHVQTTIDDYISGYDRVLDEAKKLMKA